MAGISEHWERIRIEGACCLHAEGEPEGACPMTTDYARRHLVKTILDFDSLKYDLSFFFKPLCKEWEAQRCVVWQ